MKSIFFTCPRRNPGLEIVVVVVQVQVTTCGTAKVAKSSYFASHLNERPPALGYRSETIISKDVSHDVCKKKLLNAAKKKQMVSATLYALSRQKAYRIRFELHERVNKTSIHEEE